MGFVQDKTLEGKFAEEVHVKTFPYGHTVSVEGRRRGGRGEDGSGVRGVRGRGGRRSSGRVRE